LHSCSWAWSAPAQTSRPLPTRILIKPRAAILREETAALHAQNGVRLHRRYPAIGGLEVLDVPTPLNVQGVAERYRKSPLIDYAESDWFVRGAYAPNDPRFADGSLWNFNNAGALGGKADADIDAPEAWDLQRDAGELIASSAVDTLET
jgi:hypothetical protein